MRRLAQIAALAVSNLWFFRILQTGFVCPFLYCHGCPFAAFGCPIGVIQNFIIYRQVPLFAIGSLGVYGMLLGRVFCGWACPFGALHDLLSSLRGDKSFKTRPFWYMKFIVLFIVLGAAWYAMDTVFCKFCPSGSLFGAIPFYILNPSISVGKPFYIHMFTLALTIVLALLISRFWCRYLCPMGAIAGAFNKVSMVNINLDEKRCKKCNVCLQACSMGITKLEDIGNSTDCILCGRCVEACPEKVLRFTIKK
ncbi:4Fe-4S binding protein [Candidatus Bathyarchaeota archaeon]|nr:4Fe-4S binding protein [Candidatus Bathyarchaeota archaeon]